MFGSSSGIYEDGLVKVFLDIRYGGARAAAMANEYRTRVRGSLREAREPHIQLLTQDLWDLGLPREFTPSSRVRIHWSDGLMGCEWFAVPGSRLYNSIISLMETAHDHWHELCPPRSIVSIQHMEDGSFVREVSEHSAPRPSFTAEELDAESTAGESEAEEPEDESEEVEDPATNNTESRALSLSRSATPVNSVTSTKRACSSPHPEEPSKKFARSEDEVFDAPPCLHGEDDDGSGRAGSTPRTHDVSADTSLCASTGSLSTVVADVDQEYADPLKDAEDSNYRDHDWDDTGVVDDASCIVGSEADLAQLQSDYELIRQLLAERDMKVSGLQQRLLHESSRIMALESAKDSLEREYTLISDRLAEETELRMKLELRLEDQGNEYNSLEDDLHGLEDEYEKLKELLCRDMETHEAYRCAVEHELNGYRNDLSDARLRQTKLQDQLDAARNVQDQHAAVIAEYRRKEEGAAAISVYNLQTITLERDGLAERLNAQQAARDKLQEKLLQERQYFKRKIDVLQQQLSQRPTQETLESVTADKIRLEGLLQTETTKAMSLASVVDELRRKIGAQEQEIFRLMSVAEKAMGRARAERTRCEDLISTSGNPALAEAFLRLGDLTASVLPGSDGV